MYASGVISDSQYKIKNNEPAIGEGNLSYIYQAEQVRNGNVIRDLRLVAKVFKRRTFTLELKRIFTHQSEKYRVRSPYIVEVFDWCVLPQNGMPHIKDHLVVMEFVNGVSLDKYIDKSELLFKDKIKLMKQLTEAVNEFQRFNWIHRDLKPTNIIVNDHGNIKIIDLDLAVEEGVDIRWRFFQGTYEYSAPEVLESREYSKASDNWSLGILLYFILYGKHPIQRDLPIENLDQIKSNRTYCGADFPFDPVYGDLNNSIKKLLVPEPARRERVLPEVLIDLERIEILTKSVFSKWYYIDKNVKPEFILIGVFGFLILISIVLNEALR